MRGGGLAGCHLWICVISVGFFFLHGNVDCAFSCAKNFVLSWK